MPDQVRHDEEVVEAGRRVPVRLLAYRRPLTYRPRFPASWSSLEAFRGGISSICFERHAYERTAYAVGRDARTGWQGSLPGNASRRPRPRRRLRQQGRTTVDPLEEKALIKALSGGHFMNSVVMIDVGGGTTARTLPKDVQFHP
jgi:hypothetical protein